MIFPPNKIICMQDFAFYDSVPEGVDFKVTHINAGFKLTAPRFGGKPYGNGAFFIKEAHAGDLLPQLMSASKSS